MACDHNQRPRPRPPAASGRGPARSTTAASGHSSAHAGQSMRSDNHPTHDNEWREEHLKLIEANRSKYWYRLLRICMYAHDYDPYAIFKSDPEYQNMSHSIRAKSSLTNLSGHIKRFQQSLRQQQQQQQSLGTQALALQNRATGQTNNQHDQTIYTHSSLFRTPDLLMRQTKRDESRHKSIRFLRLFVIYWFIKFVTITLVQHTRLRYKYLVPKNQSRPLVSLETTEFIAHHLGNPYYPLEDISLSLFLVPAGFTFICFILFPIYYARHPWNIANLRFILDPLLELKRIDMSIRYRLAAVRSSLQVYKSQQAHSYRQARLCCGAQEQSSSTPHHHHHQEQQQHQQHESGLLFDINELEMLEGRYCEKIEKMLDEFSTDPDELKSFRPIIFTPAHYASMVPQWQKSVTGSNMAYIFCWWFITTGFNYSAYSYKCPGLNCNPLHVLTGPEICSILEFMVVLALTNLSSTLNMSTFTMLSQCQLNLIKSIKAELHVCKLDIMHYIETERGGRRKRCSTTTTTRRARLSLQHKTTTIIKILIDEPPPPPPQAAATTTQLAGTTSSSSSSSLRSPQASNTSNYANHADDINDGNGDYDDDYAMTRARDKLERQIFKAIIRLIVCDIELKDNSKSISEQVVHPFFYVIGTLILAMVNVQIKFTESNYLRWFIVISIWLSFNVAAVQCANTYARILGYERDLWSILAEILQLFKDHYYQRETELEPTDYITTMHRLFLGVGPPGASGGAGVGGKNDLDTGPHGPSFPLFEEFSSQASGPGSKFVQRRLKRRLMRIKCCTFVADLWVKFVYSASLNVERHCSRLLNIELNYQTIIEANFFSIFIYSLTIAQER